MRKPIRFAWLMAFACLWMSTRENAVGALCQENPLRPAVPELIAKGNGYFVHYLPASRDFQLARAHDPLGRETDSLLLHTNPSTGQMKVMLKARMDRFELLGYTADKERLYVALRSQFLIKHADSNISDDMEVRFQLHTYWLEDGERIDFQELFDSNVPHSLRKGGAVASGGPIELTTSGVKCFGKTYRFEGKKILK